MLCDDHTMHGYPPDRIRHSKVGAGWERPGEKCGVRRNKYERRL